MFSRSSSNFTDTDPGSKFRRLVRKVGRIRQLTLREDTASRQYFAVHYDSPRLSSYGRGYLELCYCVWVIQSSPIWNQYILSCIVMAGILVGLQTYPGMEDNLIVESVDKVIVYSFSVEIIFKIMSEGLQPQWFLLSRQDRYWNVFDTVVIVACLPFVPIGAKQIAVLRLLRLARLGKLFKRIPQLQMIMSGLFTGMKSIFYILVLEVLICYVYAVAGILFFRNTNGAYHFRSIEVAFLSILSILTYDNWGDILYTNYYGCDTFGVRGLGYYTNIPTEDQGRLGGILYCSNPDDGIGAKVLTIFWFFTFVFLAGWCILSMFIGSVIMGMVESTEEMIFERKRKTKKDKKKSIAHEIERLMNVNHVRHMDRAAKRVIRLINLVFTGRSLTESRLRNYNGKLWYNTLESMWGEWKLCTYLYYIKCVDLCADIAENSIFKNFITLNIIIASLQIGLSTDLTLNKQLHFITSPLDNIILSFFTLEVFVKVVAEGSSPWAYFNSHWNKFDFFIVAISYVSNSADLASGNLLMMLRLLRLLRIFKLLRAYPKLQVIVTAIFNSLSSVFYIGLIIFIFLYFYAIIGMSLFANVDPWHYTYLHSALMTLFQGITFDNWTPIVLTEAYGCFAPVWLYQSNYQEQCDSSLSGNFTLAFIYFLSFDIVGGFILLSLFIGVVNVYMDVTRHDLYLEQLIEIKVEQVKDDNELDSFTVNLYREVFHMIDFSKSGYLGSDELRFGLVIAGNELSEKEFDELKSKVDKNNDNKIDFSEFLSFALDLKNQRDPIRLQMKHKKEIRHQNYSMINTRSKTDEDFATQNSSELKSEDGQDPKGCCTSLMMKLYRSRSTQVSPNNTPPRESSIGGGSQKVFPLPELVSSSPFSPVRMASQKKMVSWRDSFDDKKLEEIFPAEPSPTTNPVESTSPQPLKVAAVQHVRRRILSSILTSALKSTSTTVASSCNSSNLAASTLKSNTEFNVRTPSPSYRQKEELVIKALNDIQNAVTKQDNQELQKAIDAAKELTSSITL